MRNTKQGASTLEGGDSVSMQQLMETICILQQAVAASKADQDRIMAEVQAEQAANQNRFQDDLAGSRANNEELRRANKELRRDLQHIGERTTDERTPPIPIRARPHAVFTNNHGHCDTSHLHGSKDRLH